MRLAALFSDPHAFGTSHARCAAWPEARWREQLRTLTTFVAVVDSEDVGMVRCAVDTETADAVWLISMWVAPQARRRGIAGSLLHAVIDWADAQCGREVRLDVRVHNEPAMALYRRVGFAPFGPPVPEPPPDEHILEQRFVLPLGRERTSTIDP